MQKRYYRANEIEDQQSGVRGALIVVNARKQQLELLSVKDLAYAVRQAFGERSEASINEWSQPDKRSYKVKL